MRAALTRNDLLTVVAGQLWPATWIAREDDTRFIAILAPFEYNTRTTLLFADEGITWCRGQCEEARAALAAAYALSRLRGWVNLTNGDVWEKAPFTW